MRSPCCSPAGSSCPSRGAFGARGRRPPRPPRRPPRGPPRPGPPRGGPRGGPRGPPPLALPFPNVAALGLMGAVTWELARAALVDWLTTLLALVATAMLVRLEVNSAWLILGGGVVGVVYRLVAG